MTERLQNFLDEVSTNFYLSDPYPMEEKRYHPKVVHSFTAVPGGGLLTMIMASGPFKYTLLAADTHHTQEISIQLEMNYENMGKIDLPPVPLEPGAWNVCLNRIAYATFDVICAHCLFPEKGGEATHGTDFLSGKDAQFEAKKLPKRKLKILTTEFLQEKHPEIYKKVRSLDKMEPGSPEFEKTVSEINEALSRLS